jgi:hypothetical protein
MKRKNKNGRGEKSPWQAVPMGKLRHLVANWESYKQILIELRKDPVKLKGFLKNHAVRDLPLNAMDSLIAAERTAVSAWLRNPDESGKSTLSHDSIAVLKLWESLQAALELCDGEQFLRWLSHKSNEEQLLIARLSRSLSRN